MGVPEFVDDSSAVLSRDRSELCDGVVDWVGGVTADRPIKDDGAGHAADAPRRSRCTESVDGFRREIPVARLLAADGATFSGLVEKIESRAKASYLVALDRGSDRKVENGSKVFASEIEATAWIDSEADIRGFKSYSLSLKYLPNDTGSPLTPDMIGLRQRWRL
jgi:hypothetical protein